MRMRFGLPVLVASLVLGACVGGSKGLSSEDKDRLKPFILEAMPSDPAIQKLDVNFENKIHLVGFKADPALAKPGTEVTLTYYWRVDDTLDEGWSLFTHVQDDANDSPIGNLDGVGPLREPKGNKQMLGPERWEKGKFYVDEQKYKVPDGVKGATFTVFTGIWKADARLHVVAGPADDQNRAVAGKVKTGLTPPPPEEKPKQGANDLPQLGLTKLAAADKITVDGKGDEKAWGSAKSTGPFVDVGTGQPNASIPSQGSAKLLFDDQNLYALVEWRGPTEPYQGFKDAKEQPGDFTAAGQPKLWTKDTVELMIDPDGDGDSRDYYELQINAQNKVFKSHFDTRQMPNGGPNGPFGHEDWDPKLKSAVQLTKEGDKVVGFVVEVAIPWVGFHKAERKPPRPGDAWRMNFYAMRDNGGTSWSPILRQGNFHTASRFGRVQWGEPEPVKDAGAGEAGATDAGGKDAAPATDAAGIRFVPPLKATAAPPH